MTDQYNIYDGDYDGSGSTALVNAFSGLRSGYYYSSYASRQGYNGNYWSSTWESPAYMYYAAIHDGNISYMLSQYSRNTGFPVRCVLGS